MRRRRASRVRRTSPHTDAAVYSYRDSAGRASWANDVPYLENRTSGSHTNTLNKHIQTHKHMALTHCSRVVTTVRQATMTMSGVSARRSANTSTPGTSSTGTATSTHTHTHTHTQR